MSAARIVAGFIVTLSAAVPACSDGGPPGATTDWDCSSCSTSPHAPELAADSGKHVLLADAAGGDTASPDATSDREQAQRVDSSQPGGSKAMSALCDGSPGITFSALAIGGGQPQL